MPIAVGLYLPFGLALPILLGGVVERATRQRGEADERGGPGVLFASGVVAGEALVGVGIAFAVGLGVAASTADYSGSKVVSFIAALVVLATFAAAARAHRARDTD